MRLIAKKKKSFGFNGVIVEEKHYQMLLVVSGRHA